MKKIEKTPYQKLELMLAAHPYFEEHAMKPNFIHELKKLHNTTLSEIEKAIEAILSRADEFVNPIGMLLSLTAFQDGKNAINTKKRTIKPDKATTQYEVPDYSKAKIWYDSLKAQEQNRIDREISARMQELSTDIMGLSSTWQNCAMGQALLAYHYKKCHSQLLQKIIAHYRQKERAYLEGS